MLSIGTAHKSICASCRLSALIQAQRFSRSRASSQIVRGIQYTAIRQYPRVRHGRAIERLDRFHQDVSVQQYRNDIEDDYGVEDDQFPSIEEASSEERVLRARQLFGTQIPEGILTADEQTMYNSLYWESSEVEESMKEQDVEEFIELAEEEEWDGLDDVTGTGVLVENRDGELEEIEFQDETPVREQANLVDRRARAKDQSAEDEQALTLKPLDYTQADSIFEEGYEPRTHPVTAANKFGTIPSALALPRAKYVEPIAMMLKASPNTHLSAAAHRIFGGVGLPHSAATPSILKTMQQKPIALEPSQSIMSPIEGDAYLAVLTPALFACITNILVETRKRLGTAWGEAMVKKAAAGQLRILDAGAGGAGVMAVREVLRAEWERMHANQTDGTTELASADGRIGGAAVDAPLGKATVLTASPALRRRMSSLLHDTTFVPRLPNYAHTETAKLTGKYDIIIAPHTIWPLKEDYLRKAHVQNLWSLLSNDGGVLVLMEKGTSRGFEMIAGARELLLSHHIASPGSETRNTRVDEPEITWDGNEAPDSNAAVRSKDTGMIIAPCTNHESCPMYIPKGKLKGRQDTCSVIQRYVRPRYLQTILGAKEKNWEDVEFSYLSVMRGRDLRQDAVENVEQGKAATDRAFDGYYDSAALHFGGQPTQDKPHSLSLPRLVLPPLKREGHVILDVCTPAGTLERWTVPKSYGKLAYRDARKSTWGDLWALGAKTRLPRITHVNKHAHREAQQAAHRAQRKEEKKQSRSPKKYDGIDTDEHGRLVFGEKDIPLDGGKARTRKIKGIREKRDKKGTGNGRRKSNDYD